MADADGSPGWDAIEATLDRLYPGVAPLHFGTIIKYHLGGKDPLDGFSAWKRLEPVPHWHIVTFGFSELYAKEQGSDPAVSGFELTIRLACAPDDAQPPNWVFGLLQNLARYVLQTGNLFKDGDWMPANGPIARDEATALVSMAFCEDPDLGAIDTPSGSLRFLQVIGITADEEAAAKQWQTRKLMETLLPHMPLWVTDLARGSLLERADMRAAVAAGCARDGSSTGVLFTDVLDWRDGSPAVLTIAGPAARAFTTLLPLRLPFGRTLRLLGDAGAVMFEPGEHAAVEPGETPVVRLTPAGAQALAASGTVPGVLRVAVQAG